ncbi:hypothetical protein JS562_05145, partial [Agrobacterium sp. S2]|nr:hypothetical protein [Agrobacterium sp. S2]
MTGLRVYAGIGSGLEFKKATASRPSAIVSRFGVVPKIKSRSETHPSRNFRGLRNTYGTYSVRSVFVSL